MDLDKIFETLKSVFEALKSLFEGIFGALESFMGEGVDDNPAEPEVERETTA